VRAGFDQSTEFHDLAAAMTLNGSASGNQSSSVSDRLDPFNQTGDQLAAREHAIERGERIFAQARPREPDIYLMLGRHLN
jgi:hypothetical protein